MEKKEKIGDIIFKIFSEVIIIIGAFSIASSIFPLTIDGLEVINYEGLIMGIIFISLAILMRKYQKEDNP